MNGLKIPRLNLFSSPDVTLLCIEIHSVVIAMKEITMISLILTPMKIFLFLNKYDAVLGKKKMNWDQPRLRIFLVTNLVKFLSSSLDRGHMVRYTQSQVNCSKTDNLSLYLSVNLNIMISTITASIMVNCHLYHHLQNHLNINHFWRCPSDLDGEFAIF